MGKKSSGSPPAPDPRMFDIMKQEADQGNDLIDFIKSSWAEQKPLQDQQTELSNEVTKQQMNLADSAENRANDQYNFYKDQGRPVLAQAFDDAKNWDSADNIAKARGQAAADVQQQFDNAQGQNDRLLTRMGINPSSGKFAALNSQIGAQKALGIASATDQAQQARMLQAAQMREQAGNLASGLPASSQGFAGQASGMGTAAAGVGAQNLAGMNAGRQSYASGISQGGNMLGNTASQYGNLYGTAMQGYGLQQQANAQSSAGMGQLAGMAAMAFMKDGGPVRGPGSGTSDSVPAFNSSNGQPIRLSNGEYIISADVVRAKGREFFDKLQSKYHMPVNRPNTGNLGRTA